MKKKYYISANSKQKALVSKVIIVVFLLIILSVALYKADKSFYIFNPYNKIVYKFINTTDILTDSEKTFINKNFDEFSETLKQCVNIANADNINKKNNNDKNSNTNNSDNKSNNNKLLELVDKKHELPKDYKSLHLVVLDNYKKIKTTKKGLMLDLKAADALAQMIDAAYLDNVDFVLASAYRSYDRQKIIFEANAKQKGAEIANMTSARPGQSQHQLGYAVDFYPLTESYEKTDSFKWLLAHADKYGFSLSYPKNNYPTGYNYEPWHWRYIGVEAAVFQKKFFSDSQQKMLEFIDKFRQITM